jgi:TPP-dependent trihydroxycyclohexane-1,2-dione (THcHDO) dehydratase
MDYLYRPVSYTPSRTAVDADGKVRLVLAARDPGYANWIDNQSYTAGVLTFRNVQARHAPELRTTVVDFADIASHLPADSKTSSREQRVAEMWTRFNAIRWRYPAAAT